MRVIITGAAGNIGQEIARELGDSHELTLIDRKSAPGRQNLVLDLAQCCQSGGSLTSDNLNEWKTALTSTEAIIHLAEDPDARSPAERVFNNNIHATWNILQAAATHNVRRVIYASSGWVVKAAEAQLAPQCYTNSGSKLTSETPVCPTTFYGLGKAFGELAGRSYVESGMLNSFLAVRIGWFDPSCPKDEAYEHLKVTAQDLRSFFRRCVEAPFSGFHVVYAVSAQDSAPYDLSYTSSLLGWKPSPLPRG